FELNPEGIPGKRQRGRFHVGGDGRGIPYLLSFSKAYGGNIKWIKRAGGTGTITRLSLPLGLVPPSFKSGSVEKLNGARLTFQDSDHVLSHPSDYFQETLGQFVSERLGNGNVIDIGGDGNFIRLTASDLASEGVQLNEIYSMDIASLKRINPSDKDGVFEAQTLLGQDHPLRRLKVEPAAQVLEEKFSLMFMNAPVLEGASLGKGGFRDWVYDAKFFGAEDAVLLVRLHTDDIRNGRIGRFVSVLNGSSQESVNPANPSYGPVADMLGIVPFEGRNYQLTDFHTHMPQKMLTTPYTSNSPVPIVEFKRTDSVSDSQKKSLAGKITGIVLETKNAQIRSVGLGLLITLRDYAGDFVIAEADRFRKIYDRAVSEPYTDTVRGDIQILFDAYGLPVSGARLAGPEEILIDPSDAEARSAWESKSDAASKLGPFSLSALAAKKLNISDRFYELLTDAGLIPQGQQELSSIASLITNPYELDAWQHLLDAAIQNPDNFYERIEPYFSNDFARQSNSWITVDTQTHRFSGTGYSVFSVNQMWSDNTIPLSEKIMMTLTLLGTEEVDRNYTFSRAVLELAKNISFSDSEGLLAVKTQTKILAEELREYIRAFIISKTAPYTKDLALYHGTPYSTDSDESIFSRPDTVYLTPLKDEASEYGDGGVLYKLQVPIDSIVDVSGWGTSEWEFIAAAESEGGGYSVLEKTDLSEPGSRLSADTQNLKDRIASVERTIRTFRYLGVSRFMTLWRKTASDDQKKEIFRRAMSFKSAQDRQWSYDQTFGWEKVHVKKLQRNILIAAGIGISAFWIPYTAYTLIPLGVNSIFLHIYPVLMQKYIRKRIERINLKEQLKEAEMRDSGSRLSDRSVADMVISDPYSISKILITINSWARAGKLYTHQEGTTYFGGSADEGVRENIFAITVPIFHYAFYRMSENGLPSLPLEYVYEDSESGPKITLTLSSYERDSTLFRMADIAVKNLSETFGFDVNTSQTDEGFKFEINIPSKKIFNSRSSRSSLGSLNVQTGMYPLTLEVKKYLEENERECFPPMLVNNSISFLGIWGFNS
ncbi:MAG: hypothetical protein KC649_03185, partial [Candidatus Omnitrophica bacterium]|nr:hypothetical protein [Candidatus Omnitrophota bacterium]